MRTQILFVAGLISVLLSGPALADKIEQVRAEAEKHVARTKAAGDKAYQAELNNIKTKELASAQAAEDQQAKQEGKAARRLTINDVQINEWQYHSQLQTARQRGEYEYDVAEQKRLEAERNAANKSAADQYKNEANLQNGGTVLTSGMKLIDIGGYGSDNVNPGTVNKKAPTTYTSGTFRAPASTSKSSLVKRVRRNNGDKLEISAPATRQ